MTNDQRRIATLKRLEWASNNTSGGEYYANMLRLYTKKLPPDGWSGVDKFLDSKEIPSADEINSGFDKNNMQVRGQAFANTVDQLKASVECTAAVETKIQAALSFMDIHLVHDNYSVSSEPWIAVIQADGKSKVDITLLNDCDADRLDSWARLKQEAADGEIWIGTGSPEVALAEAMVDFRRDQLKILGLYA